MAHGVYAGMVAHTKHDPHRRERFHLAKSLRLAEVF
jgi:hypothetical protein